ncbi:hypothetical protein [Nocardia sp. NRRL S-836]|uniref:hypothetical protein n=1 Tax=Nocardia sp. NRRL S-836 TaxID=1519492 RepID=UPI0006AEDCFD|nr:hypothetical protein [Nocardia sp. NRRL S-836]KOV83813.1 hypothetical protein ADL03_19080 [Nocardia sp. NRRL S-836]
MILIIPVRYAQDDAVWSRELFVNWMQPLRPFSLGNYWALSSHGFLDVTSDVLDPVDIPNPVPVSNEARDGLHRTVVKAATDQRKPDWANVDTIIIWFARPTGWWGGGQVAVPVGDGARDVNVTVVDSVTPFDAACQELGHSFGFDHEWAADGTTDYGSPYSTMSAQRYGVTTWQDPAWVRDPISGLPDGEKTGRIIGPLLPAAQMCAIQGFHDSQYVVHQRAFPLSQRLYALDYRLREPKGPLPVVVAVPSNRRDGRTFFLELRRRNRTGYDNGIGEWKDVIGAKHTGPDEAVVVHSRNPDGRIRYEGTAPLRLARKQPDWPFPVGDFTVRINHVDADHEFVDVEVRAGSARSFPIRGVLLAGRFRTQEQLNAMSLDDMRNTLIVVMTSLSNQNDYQRYDNDTLAGMGAVMVFLRRTGIRDDAALGQMSADDQRNTTIVELDAQTGVGRELQGHTDLELAQIALGRLASPGRVPGAADHYVRGVLLLGGFRTQHELNTMSDEDMRNRLIVVMTSLSNQNDYQGYNNSDLAGVGAVMVFLRETGIRDDAALRQMSADDQRNTAIVALDAQTRRGRQLQGLSNLDLAKVALGVERV